MPDVKDNLCQTLCHISLLQDKILKSVKHTIGKAVQIITLGKNKWNEPNSAYQICNKSTHH